MELLRKLFKRKEESNQSPTASPSSMSLSTLSSRSSASSSWASPASSSPQASTEQQLPQHELPLEKTSLGGEIQPVSPQQRKSSEHPRSRRANFTKGKSLYSDSASATNRQQSSSASHARVSKTSPRSSPDVLVELDGPMRSDAKETLTSRSIQHTSKTDSVAQMSSLSSPVSVLDTVHNVGADCQELVDAFRVIDANNDGKISESELGAVLRLLGANSSDEEIHLMMLAVDSDRDGQLDLDEFIRHNTLPAGRAESRAARSAELRAAFHLFDIDKNNFISAGELHQVLRGLGDKRATMEECSCMIRAVDCDGDGQVNFEEFERMMGGT